MNPATNKPTASEIQKSHYSEKIDVLDKRLDLLWGASQKNTKAPKSYYDYYFSGQDVMIYVDGVEDQLPIEGLAFQVEQKKTPVYGAHSYTYDAVMRGTRIISGSFRITTTTPGFMTDLISDAAASRSKLFASMGSDVKYLPSISESYGDTQNIDAENIDRYWTISREKSRSGFLDGKNIFSSHPPFDFVIVHGLQSASLQENVMVHNRGKYESAVTDAALYTDVNERLTETSSAGTDRIVIKSIELNSCQYEYSPSGQPLSETYTFFAKDYYVTSINKR